MESGPQIDFMRLCRACKSEGPDLISLFDVCEIPDENPRIDEMLMACTSVQVKLEDGLPSYICLKCAQLLKSAYVFKLQCQQTDNSLREFARSVRLDIKDEGQGSENLFPASVVETVTEDRGELPNEDPHMKSDFIEFLDNNQMILTCRDCCKVFTTLEGLRSHKRIHLGTLFKCKYCGKGYTRQTHVFRHELSHGKHKLHVCRICNKTLTRMEHLKRHLTTHLKEKPYACEACHRGFNRTDHLDNHKLRCKGERLHICDICNRGFAREDSLEVHKRLHENQKPVLPTLDNIDNIEEHYYEIDHDPNVDFSPPSPESDIDDYLEPQVEVTESFDESKTDGDFKNESANVSIEGETTLEEDIKDVIDSPDVSYHDDGMDDDRGAISGVEELEDSTVAVADHQDIVPNDVPEEDSDSVHSEYLPTKSSPPKGKRKRGRPRKNPPKIPGGRPRGRPPTAKRKKDVGVEEEEGEDEGEFPCSHCNEVFTRISLLERHTKKQHENSKFHTCKTCKKEFTRFNHLKRHMYSHSIVKPFGCEKCNRKFSRRDHLQQHLKLHEKKEEYICDICTRPFSRIDQLAKHKASKHSIGEKISVMGEKKFECHICLKNFTTEKYRDVHLKGHMGDKRYKCKTCDKCFLSKSHLTEHVKFHNEHSKKFLCSECGQRFIRNDYLVIHMRRHRGEKPFKCKFCGKGFPRTTDLTVHERYHTGEKTHLCTICGRGFGRAYNLTVHMRTHTGEKPYQCTYCDAAFAQGNDLKAHVRRHTGERFQCELCSESFLMGYLLTQHKRTVHGLNVVSNIRRLQPANKIKQDLDESPPITIPLPKPVVPDMVMNSIHNQITFQMQHQLSRE